MTEQQVDKSCVRSMTEQQVDTTVVPFRPGSLSPAPAQQAQNCVSVFKATYEQCMDSFFKTTFDMSAFSRKCIDSAAGYFRSGLSQHLSKRHKATVPAPLASKPLASKTKPKSWASKAKPKYFRFARLPTVLECSHGSGAASRSTDQSERLFQMAPSDDTWNHWMMTSA